MIGRNAHIVLSLASMLALTSCTTSLPQSSSPDRHLASEPATSSSSDIPAIVGTTPMETGSQPTVAPELYSVVAQDVPARELLFAMARDANINIDVHPDISGQVNLNAINQSLPQILERISGQTSIRWEFDSSDNLIIQPDTPYWKTYRVDYVNVDRSANTSLDISTSITSVGENSANVGGNNSSSSINQNSSNTFWTSLEENLEALLSDSNSDEQQDPVVINSEAGLVNIRANAKKQAEIQEFIRYVESRVLQQVLIEATVVEVRLSDSFQSGVDWSTIGASINGNVLDFSQNVTSPGLSSAPNSIFSYGSANGDNDITATVSLLEQFGDLRVLSSPKIMALNNQPALLRVVDNKVYFNVEVEPGVVGGVGIGSTPTITTTINTVPVGFVMTVTPQVGDNDQVTLNVRPTISRIVGFVEDPNPDLANAGQISEIPEIQINEMESVLKVYSGEIAVLGGLMQDSLQENVDGIPVLSRLPGVGRLFSYQQETAEKTELIVFIRPVVVKEPSLNGDLNQYLDYLPESGLNF